MDEKKGYFKDDFMVEGESTHYLEDLPAQQIQLQLTGQFEYSILKAGGRMKITTTSPGSFVSTSMIRFTRDYVRQSDEMFGEQEISIVYADNKPTLTQRKTGRFKHNRLVEGELFQELVDGTACHTVETGLFNDNETLHNVLMPKKHCSRHIYTRGVLTETLEGIFSAGNPIDCVRTRLDTTPFLQSYGKWKMLESTSNHFKPVGLHDRKGVHYMFDQITHTGMWQEGFSDGLAITPHVLYQIRFKDEQLFSVTKEDKNVSRWSMTRRTDGEYHYQPLIATTKKPNKLEKEEAILGATTQFEYIDAWLIAKKKAQPFKSTLTLEDLIKKEAEDQTAHHAKKQLKKKKVDEANKQKKASALPQQAYVASLHEDFEPHGEMQWAARSEMTMQQGAEPGCVPHQQTFFEKSDLVLAQEKQDRLLTEEDEGRARQGLFFFDERGKREILSRGHAIFKLAPRLPLAHDLPALIIENDDADLEPLVLALYRIQLMSFLMKAGLCFDATSIAIVHRKAAVQRTLLRSGIDLIELEETLLNPAVRMAGSAWLFHLAGGVLSLSAIQAEMQDCFELIQWRKIRKWDKALVNEAWCHEVFAMYRTLGLPLVDAALAPLSRPIPAELQVLLREGAAIYIRTLEQPVFILNANV